MYMITGSGSTAVKQRFSYDADGNLVAVVYKNGTSTAYTCYYLRNAQGDIVKLIDGNGNTKEEYTYIILLQKKLGALLRLELYTQNGAITV